MLVSVYNYTNKRKKLNNAVRDRRKIKNVCSRSIQSKVYYIVKFRTTGNRTLSLYVYLPGGIQVIRFSHSLAGLLTARSAPWGRCP